MPSALDLAQALECACLSACACLTKTPEIHAHAAGCPYRTAAELADVLRGAAKDHPVLSWDTSGARPVGYLRLDLAFGRSEVAIVSCLESLTSQLRSLLPRARFHEADPRPLMDALSKAEAILSCKPSFVPLENQDDG